MILLADDSITIQKIVNLTFSGEGIDVVTVGNGDAALRKIHEHHPSLVLADIFMPGKNGYEVCEAIKNDEELQSIPVILLVGAFEPFDSHEAARVRADSHLTKPFEIKALISAVRSLIEAAEQRAAVMTEPEVASGDAFVEAEEVTEPVSVPTPSVERVEEPIHGAVRLAPLQEVADHVEERPLPLPLDAEASGVIPEEIPEGPVTVESGVVPEQPVALPETTLGETQEIAVLGIEETDPLGLESVEGGLGLASFPVGDVADTKSLVVDIWEAAETPAVTEPVSLKSEVLLPPSLAVEPERAEIASSPETLTEEVSESSVPEQEVSPSVLVSPAESSESAPDVSAAQTVSSSASPLRVSAADVETAELVDMIANKVVEKLSREVIEKIAWEVIPDLAELMIKDQVESHFKTINGR